MDAPFVLPMLEWINIPGGEVTLENTAPQAYDINRSLPSVPLATFKVAPFAIARYPITIAQFDIFLDTDDGYSHTEWWDFADAARAWRVANPYPVSSRFRGNNRPRENVSWYEALAFCRWLAHKLNKPVTLPTEMQWQRAAQGDDGREFPYGPQFDPKKCNTSASNDPMSTQTTDVDHYPEGKSAFGVMDMAGNVDEWCLNKFENPADTDLDGNDYRPLRGGSAWGGKNYTRCVSRLSKSRPTARMSERGFRPILYYRPRSPDAPIAVKIP